MTYQAYPYEKAKSQKTGRWVLRKDWEKTHKPVCSVYPCPQWHQLHWHFNLPKEVTAK